MTDVCPICIDPLTLLRCHKLPCSHVYHTECLDRLLDEGFTICPLCSAPIPNARRGTFSAIICSIIVQTALFVHIITTTVFLISGLIHVIVHHDTLEFFLILFFIIIISSTIASTLLTHLIRFG